MAKPMKPAACRRAPGPCGEPAHRCHRPSTDSPTNAAPRISRGRASGLGSVRISVTAAAVRTTGSTAAAEPTNIRSTASTHAPTGRAASNHELAAMTTATPSSISAIPSRRWPGSMSRARPTERAAAPAVLATSSHVLRTASAQLSPMVTGSDRVRRFLRRLRDALARGDRELPREAACDLPVRVPDRATVLLAMVASLISKTP